MSKDAPITDSERLTWLIKEGAYGLIIHNSYYSSSEEVIQAEVRNRIDEYILKERVK